MQYSSSLSKEKRYLGEMLKKIKASKAYYDELSEQTDRELKQLRRMYTSATPEFYNDIPTKEQFLALYTNRGEECGKALKKPYFGKIIYQSEDMEKEAELYIGKKGISDHLAQEKIWIIDWRAPVSQLYYSGNIGKTKYSGPKGEMKADLKLKTTLDIEEGRLLGLYDSEVVANDDLLVKYLSKNKDVVLNEIIATIQEDQDKIIRKPLSTNVVVQGVAGSGKTTVALHRISYLLYTYRKKMSSENIYILAANRLFLNYITSMLPDMDVPNAGQGTLGELVGGLLKKKLPRLKYKPDAGSSDYSSINFDAVDYFIREYKEEIFSGTAEVMGMTIWPEGEAVSQVAELHEMPIETLANLMDSRLGTSINFNAEKFKALLREQERESGSIARAEIIEKRFKSLRAAARHYYYKRIKTNGTELLKSFREKNNLAPKAPSKLNLDDLCLMIILINRIDESCVQKNIRHVVVDEAQDLSAVQYLSLKSIFKNATFTIVGDVMQNISSHSIQGWAEVTDKVFNGNSDYEKLLKSYRNTIEISDFAKKVVEYHTGEEFETFPLVRRGKQVSVIKNAKKNEALRQIAAEIQNGGYALNAIICKTEKSAKKLYEKMKDEIELTLMDAQNATLQKGTYVLSVADSKGLEFDCVVIYDFDDYDLKGESIDYKLLYVASTRALHELTVFTDNRDFY